MFKKIYTSHFSYWTRGILLLAVLLFFQNVGAQSARDRGRVRQSVDSVTMARINAAKDSIAVTDTVPKPVKVISPNAVTSIVTYSAKDSAINDLQNRLTYLFGEAVVKYDDMELRADYIRIDFANSELYASGVADSSGVVRGSPVFVEGASNYRAQEIKYNFNTRKGKITRVITTQDEGFIHGEQVKKLDDTTFFLKNGKFTTCELDNPHYEIDFTKAKLIQHDKIVVGPAYLSFRGVPTPLAIPFGFFPLEQGRSSGLVMPSFGQSKNLGFYLRDLGFYFAINDNIDLLLSGDVYTRGSWAIRAKSNYVFRYLCSGTVHLEFAQTRVGDKLDSSYRFSNNYKIYWDHKQDVKSHPRTRFNAHIDVISSDYTRYNISSANDYLSNQYTSSINVSTSAADIFFVDATVSYSQNTMSRTTNMKLPNVNMSVVQFYPFRKKNKAGALKWYDNISMKWNAQLTGQIDSPDSLFFKPQTWRDMNVGMMHTIPITIPIKIAKLINWNTTATLTEKWYLQNYTRNMTADTLGDVVTATVNECFHRGFGALHDLRVSSSLTTKIYFMYAFKKGGLQAIRHVVTPNLSFTYQPNFAGRVTDRYFNPITGENVEYTFYDNAIFGTVTSNTQALASISFDNNLEIKVRSRKDTITGYKKIPIIDNLNINMNYNFAADSLNWSRLTLSGRSTLFRQLYLTYGLSFDPYIINENGTRVNRTELAVNKRLFRLSSSSFSVALNWKIDQNTFRKRAQKDQKQQTDKQPWSFTFNYTFSYGINDNIYYYMLRDTVKYTHNMVHTLNVVGSVYLTRKWKVGFTTGYDFVQKDLSYTSIDVYRDMHCWEMSFNWVPFGYRKGWGFTINVKAAVLKDVLKLPLHSDYRDNL